MEKRDSKSEVIDEKPENEDASMERRKQSDQVENGHDETVCSAEFPKGCI